VIALEKLSSIVAEVGAPLSTGPAPAGERRLVPILGGTATGRLAGRILPGGADWQILRPDGFADIDARYQIATDDGARVEVWSRGLRHGPPEILDRLAQGEAVPADAYYFRTAMRFETGAPAYAWLARTLAVARGIREPDRVRLEVFALA
jgi:hypothetical protein